MTIVTRWILALSLAVFVSSAGTADAQAFKPKRSTPVKGAPAKKNPVAKKAPTTKKAVAAKPAKKRTSRAASAGRTDDLTPEDEPVAAKSSTRDDDYVLIEDDDE